MGAWTQPDYNDADWVTVGGAGCKGPPEEPYIWVEPNAFIDMQSKALSIWSTMDWLDTSKPMYFRREFEMQ